MKLTKYLKARHAMLDIETLDTEPTSVVLSIDLLVFDIKDGKRDTVGSLTVYPSALQQIFAGRSIGKQTVEGFWNQPDKVAPHVRDSLWMAQSKSAVSCAEALESLAHAIRNSQINYLWAQGAAFDFGIVSDLYKQTGMPVPWKFWQERDSRTILSGVDEDYRKAIIDEYADGRDQHTGAFDVALQSDALIRALLS